METEGFVVGPEMRPGPAKFPMRRRTQRSDKEQWQTHGYEIDLVGCRSDRLI